MKKNTVISDKFSVSGPYSAAVEAGDMIFISGQLPIDPLTGVIVTDTKKPPDKCSRTYKPYSEKSIWICPMLLKQIYF